MIRYKRQPGVCPGACRDQVFAGVKTPAVGGDLTSVKWKGEWLPLGLTVDAISGLALTIDRLSAEDSKTLKARTPANCHECGSPGVSHR